jgi:hypothetical protein
MTISVHLDVSSLNQSVLKIYYFGSQLTSVQSPSNKHVKGKYIL